MDYETPAQWLKRRLLELSITQQKLADLVGMTQPQISAYATEAKIPDVETIRRMCAVLGPYHITAAKRVIDLTA